jgi:hypothetical protein
MRTAQLFCRRRSCTKGRHCRGNDVMIEREMNCTCAEHGFRKSKTGNALLKLCTSRCVWKRQHIELLNAFVRNFLAVVLLVVYEINLNLTKLTLLAGVCITVLQVCDWCFHNDTLDMKAKIFDMVRQLSRETCQVKGIMYRVSEKDWTLCVFFF